MNLNQINKKELAVVLSVFGSSEESAMEEYHDFYNYIQEKINSNIHLRMAISSRHILKKLDNQNKNYKTIIEQLAHLDHECYKNVIVSSVNLFPIKEHENILEIVKSFDKITPTQYLVTEPLFGESLNTNIILKSIDQKLKQIYGDDSIFLYIAHGTSATYHAGNQLFTYLREYLKIIDDKNYLYTIEGSYTYDKELFLNEVSKTFEIPSSKDLIIIPLLLIAGNHYREDIISIKNELEHNFRSVIIPENKTLSKPFSLLSLDEVREYFYNKIASAIEVFR